MKSFAKRLLSMVGAGVAGSALTLFAVTNTGFMEATAPQQADAQNGQPVSESAGYQPSVLSFTKDSLADMVDSASESIVGITNYQGAGNRFAGETSLREYGTGSGVVYKTAGDDAYIITNNHVIENAQKIEITNADGEKKEASLVGTDALTDLAVVKIDASFVGKALPFGDSDKLRAGDPVVAIGNPLSLDFSGTVTQGIISSPSRSIDVKTSAGSWSMDVLQTDAAINPGNSGGALLTTDGQVIGINSLKISDRGIEGLGFAIPSNEAVPLAEQLIDSGKIDRPYIGIGLADLSEVPYSYVKDLPAEVEGGIIITSVDPLSPAAKADLKEADVITEINGEPVKNSMDLRKLLYTKLSIGDTAELTVYTNNVKRTVTVTLSGNQ